MTKLADVVEATAIRPFQVNVPEADLTDLRRRISGDPVARERNRCRFFAGRATRLHASARAVLGDRLQLAAGARRKLNSHPQFITEIDGLDIHFIHVRSKT